MTATHTTGAPLPRWLPPALFLGLLAAYLANGEALIGNDIAPSVKMADRLVRHGAFTFVPDEDPVLFHWELRDRRAPGGWRLLRFARWSDVLGPRGETARVLRRRGELRPRRPLYSMIESPYEGRYQSNFGPGAALTALPVYAVAHAVTEGERLPGWLSWFAGKWTAAACVAGAATYVLLAAARALPWGLALFVALTFGLGTCAWSVSSQALWQHGPNELWLALGVYGSLAREERRWHVVGGFALGMALMCRPTAAVAILGVGAYLLLAERGRLLAWCAGLLPSGLAMAAYNATLLGGPLRFGQAVAGPRVALWKSGSDAIWQTPLLEGAAGVLISPSRGLFVFSPVLLFALWGAVACWRDARWRWLRPLPLIVLACWVPAFLHFDWWGGWTFGYRHVVDSTLLLSLLLIPVIERCWRRRALRGLLLASVAWSVSVQLIGVLAYDTNGWNGRVGYEVRMRATGETRMVWDRAAAEALVHEGRAEPLGRRVCNIDVARYQGRLWAVWDSQLVYSLTHAGQARRARREELRRWLDDWD